MLSRLLSWTRFRGAGPELKLTLVCLVIGLVLVPVLIWCVGHLVLGAYANGGLLDLLSDYYRGLAMLSLPFWIVALGPLLLLWLLRSCAWLRAQ